MKIGDWPEQIKLVFGRRVISAPSKLQLQAFGASPVKSGYWRDNDLHIFAFGGGGFLQQISKFEAQYGVPLPGISSQETAQAAIRLSSSRRITFGKMTMNAPQPFLISGETTVLLSDLRIVCVRSGQTIQYDIPCVYLVRLGGELTWDEAATDFDFVLAQWISPLIERRP